MEAQPTSPYGALEKYSGMFAPSAAEAQAAGQQANMKLWQMIVAAAGAGALGRAGLGLFRMMQPQSNFEPSPSFQRIGVQLPQEDEQTKIGMDKAAKGPVTNLVEGGASLTEGLPWGKSWFMGSGASTPNNVPALLGLGLPLAALAAYGTWKGTDALLDWRRKSEQEGELDANRAEYERLLTEAMTKHSADDAGIEAALDELAELVHAPAAEKQAKLTDFPSKLTGVATAYALLAALASGKLSYDYFKERNNRAVTEAALERRAKERTGGVAPIYLQPSPEIA